MATKSEITRLLKRWGEGDAAALDRLMPLVYERLSQIARSHLNGERPDHSLNTQALVHETYLKLVHVNSVEWTDRAHFRSMASRVMRRILVDHARRKRARKRGGDQDRVDLRDDLLLTEQDATQLLDLDDALNRLETLAPRQAQAVSHHYFGGLTAEETAVVLGVSRATVERDLRAARAWLAGQWSDRPSGTL